MDPTVRRRRLLLAALASVIAMFIFLMAPVLLTGSPNQPVPQPNATKQTPTPSVEQDCFVGEHPDASETDYAAGNKKSEVSFGPRVNVRTKAEIKKKVPPILCGTDPRDHTVTQRGGNCNVYQGIEYALSGGTLNLSKRFDRSRCIKGVTKLVDEEIDWSHSWLECGVTDPKGSKTLYAHYNDKDQLVLAVDTLDEPRQSCQIYLVIKREGTWLVVAVRDDCMLQAGTYKAFPLWAVRWLGADFGQVPD